MEDYAEGALQNEKTTSCRSLTFAQMRPSIWLLAKEGVGGPIGTFVESHSVLSNP